MEKVSVIVPVYNDEKYLKQCLDSVLNQTYRNLEIILVDDGSTDNTPQICEQYREKDKRIRLLHKVNGGVGSSRNAGLSMATGDYLLFIDDDDWIDKDYIENLYDLLKRKKADIAICNYANFYERNALFTFAVQKNNYYEKVFSVKDWFRLEYNSKNNWSVLFAVPWCKLFKRSLFKHIAYPTNVPVEDDLTTWKVYLLAERIAYANKTKYIHRLLNSSVSTRANRTAVFPLEAVEKRIAFLKILGFDTSEEEKAYRWRLNICKEDALKDGNYVKYYDALQKLAILKKYGK